MKNKLSLSIVIPTKDRFYQLLKTLNFLKKNIFFFNEIIIVDSSAKSKILKKKLNIYKNLNIKYYKSKPSTALQRNLGFKYVNKNNKFVMFLDDDIKFNSDAFKEMKNFIKQMHPQIIGIGFNPIEEYKNNFLEKIKNSRFFCKLNIYNSKPGIVVQSGWHTKIRNIKKNQYVEWLHSAASIYKIKKINSLKFDEQLGEYSYLEDVIFSYDLSKKGKLIINSKAKFYTTNFIERNDFFFGILEIKNRIIFIKKNNFKIKNFLLGYVFFVSKNLLTSLVNLKNIYRFLGNLIGLIYLLKK